MKEHFRELIAKGQLEQALAEMQQWAGQTQAAGPLQEIILLRNRLENLQTAQRKQVAEPVAAAREQNSIADAALSLADQLPETTQPAGKTRPKGISENTLKQHILFLFLLVKVSVVGWLFTHWESGGFNTDQFTGTLTLLAPVFFTYAGIMFRDFLESRHIVQENPSVFPRIGRSRQWTIYVILLAYGLALIWLIGSKAQGAMSYATMASFFTLLESGMGIYVGLIVKIFFPDRKPSS